MDIDFDFDEGKNLIPEFSTEETTFFNCESKIDVYSLEVLVKIEENVNFNILH